MRRNRLLLCLLLAVAIVFYGMPFMNFQGDLQTVVFSVTWLFFALLVISGNLVALLYGKRVNHNTTTIKQQYKQSKKKIRQYG